MSRLRHGLTGPAVGLLTLAALLGPAPGAGAEPPRVPFGQGTHAFSRILHDLQMEPLSGPEELRRDPRHTLLIVLGETDVLDRVPGGLREFLERGGAALVATDRAVPTRLAEFGVTVTGNQVRLPPNNVFTSYHDIEECPMLIPAVGASPALLATPGLPGGGLLGFLNVATNRPSYLQARRNLPQGLTVLVNLPPACQTTDADGRRRFSPFPLKFGIGGTVGAGRLLVLADHSLFINDMMLQPDNNNIDFTYNCLDWLTAGEEPRNRVLFVEEGELQTAFDIPLKEVPLPLPPEEALVSLADDALARMEQENAFNKLLLDLVPFETVWVALVLLLTGLLACYGFYRLSQARHRVDLWAPLLETVLARHAPAQTLMEQRHRALLGRGNLWEPARALVREWFEGVGAAPAGGSAAGPPLRAAGSWWRRWALDRKVRRLWRLAYGATPVPVAPQEFARLLASLEEVKAALASGALALEPVPVAAEPSRRPVPARPGANGTRAEGATA
jgi:hypothetical protein